MWCALHSFFLYLRFCLKFAPGFYMTRSYWKGIHQNKEHYFSPWIQGFLRKVIKEAGTIACFLLTLIKSLPTWLRFITNQRAGKCNTDVDLTGFYSTILNYFEYKVQTDSRYIDLTRIFKLAGQMHSPIRTSNYKIDLPGSNLTCSEFLHILKLKFT